MINWKVEPYHPGALGMQRKLSGRKCGAARFFRCDFCPTFSKKVGRNSKRGYQREEKKIKQ